MPSFYLDKGWFIELVFLIFQLSTYSMISYAIFGELIQF